MVSDAVLLSNIIPVGSVCERFVVFGEACDVIVYNARRINASLSIIFIIVDGIRNERNTCTQNGISQFRELLTAFDFT